MSGDVCPDKYLLAVLCRFWLQHSRTLRIQPDIIINYIGLHVKHPYSLSGFSETSIFWTDFYDP